ncbi:MAG TPA: phosphoribosyltransferase [Rhodocyclaceae bacterium]|nr:phosphoribosyltransferase [Rhodocyclaceae bacterium]
MTDSLPKRCEVVSWQSFYALASRLACRIVASGYRPDIIVAIGRGGEVPGRVLSDLLDQMDLTSFKIEHYHRTQKQRVARVRYPLAADVAGRKVLLVDDVADSGETFAVALDHLNRRGAPAEVRSAVLHYKTVSTYRPDYYAAEIRAWRWIVYPWAVGEDLGGILRAMRPFPEDPGAVERRLWDEHGVRLPRAALRELLGFLAVAP